MEETHGDKADHITGTFGNESNYAHRDRGGRRGRDGRGGGRGGGGGRNGRGRGRRGKGNQPYKSRNQSWKRSNNQRSNSHQSAQPAAGPTGGQRALVIRYQHEDGRHDHIQCHNCRNYGHKAAQCPLQHSARYTHHTLAPQQSVQVGPHQPILSLEGIPNMNYQLTQPSGPTLVQPQPAFAPPQKTLQFNHATSIESGFNPRQAFVTVMNCPGFTTQELEYLRQYNVTSCLTRRWFQRYGNALRMVSS